MMDQELRFKRALYPQEAVMKAAFLFLDRCYVHVDIVGADFVINITAKPGLTVDNIAAEFTNELLAQAVRFQVYQQTHTLREILLARAMSSSLTGVQSALDADALPSQVDNLDNIVQDWFAAHAE